ncbi:hypothetical protein E3E12_07950 [Formicincola oecophyllae]|uniref:Uncharacterized protein n=1 Tax=Formicincola oecophyllae TaxID=2558361 RepID=A0A4Y6UC31_9PROT|nr:hypothetical protein [Formicincola oecophyllae]QDH14128.1 hypothetical protein E3E12_07950 [Formicincola oecophyllae]
MLNNYELNKIFNSKLIKSLLVGLSSTTLIAVAHAESTNCAAPIVEAYKSASPENAVKSLIGAPLNNCQLLTEDNELHKAKSTKQSLKVFRYVESDWGLNKERKDGPELCSIMHNLNICFYKEPSKQGLPSVMYVHDFPYNKGDNLGVLFSNGVIVQYDYGPIVKGDLAMLAPPEITGLMMSSSLPVAVVHGGEADIILPPLSESMKKDFLNAK